MTIEESIDCDADKLIKMSDAELEQHFHHMLNFTRPELIDKTTALSPRHSGTGVSIRAMAKKKNEDIVNKAAAFGIDLRGLL